MERERIEGLRPLEVQKESQVLPVDIRGPEGPVRRQPLRSGTSPGSDSANWRGPNAPRFRSRQLRGGPEELQDSHASSHARAFGDALKHRSDDNIISIY